MLWRDAWDAWRDFSQPLSDVVGCSSQLQASAAPDVVGCASQLEASGAPTPLSSQVLESAVRMSAEYHGFPGKLVDTVVDQPVIHSAANNVSAELLASAKDSVAYMRKHQQLVQERVLIPLQQRIRELLETIDAPSQPEFLDVTEFGSRSCRVALPTSDHWGN